MTEMRSKEVMIEDIKNVNSVIIDKSLDRNGVFIYGIMVGIEVLADIRDLLKRYVDISEKAVNKSFEIIDIDGKRLEELMKEVSKPESEGK